MLAGIAVGTVLGLVTGNARLVLVEGSVPTAVFGLLCLGSLWSRRPLIFRFALEFMGADTPRGRDFEGLWRYEGFRHAFRLFTVVWGVVYLAEAAARVVIVETTSTATALSVSKVMPYAVAAVLAGWMTIYGRRIKRAGERLAAAAEAEAGQHAARPTPHTGSGGTAGQAADSAVPEAAAERLIPENAGTRRPRSARRADSRRRLRAEDDAAGSAPPARRRRNRPPGSATPNGCGCHWPGCCRVR